MTVVGKRLSSKNQTTCTVSRDLPYLVRPREAKEALVGGWEGGRGFLLLWKVPHWFEMPHNPGLKIIVTTTRLNETIPGNVFAETPVPKNYTELLMPGH